MTTLLSTLGSETAPSVIFRTVHARFRELSATLPRGQDGAYSLLAADPSQVADLATILLFNQRLTLQSHPLERAVANACWAVLGMGMTALGSKPRQLAEVIADRVMSEPSHSAA